VENDIAGEVDIDRPLTVANRGDRNEGRGEDDRRGTCLYQSEGQPVKQDAVSGIRPAY
jgi:hypothetical protein